MRYCREVPVEEVAGDRQARHLAHVLDQWNWEERVAAAPVQPGKTLSESKQ